MPAGIIIKMFINRIKREVQKDVIAQPGANIQILLRPAGSRRAVAVPGFQFIPSRIGCIFYRNVHDVISRVGGFDIGPVAENQSGHGGRL